MKKRFVYIFFLLFLLTACGQKTVPESSEGRLTVEPLPGWVDPAQLQDGTFSVSYETGGAYVDDTGKMQMTVTLYDFEVFDMADIARLKVGDTILLRKKSVDIARLERLEDGTVLLNGGPEENGFALRPEDSTIFFEVTCNDQLLWNPVGTVTIPVSENFLFTDQSNLEIGLRTFYPGDFLVNDPGITGSFVPNNTSIRIEHGEIISMERCYMP